MNVLRSFARDLVQFLQADRASRAATPVEVGSQSLQAVREQKVAAVIGLSRFRDAFEQFPQGLAGTVRTLQAERAFQRPLAAQLQNLSRDGFESARRSPVDLSGGVKAPAAALVPEAPAPASAQGSFTASLDDLAGL
ncbi:MAG: hypothetical protein AB1938_05800 [Myxococcota bacterium]